MKILVLGCKGQLGRCLNDQLVNTDHEVIYTSREQIDIADVEGAKNQLLEISPDVVINATAYTAVDKAEQDQEQANLINHLAVANIANLCHQLDCWLIHVSTDYVFDGDSDEPYKEGDQTNPQSVYGETKLKGELAIKSSGCKHIIIRTAWVFSEYGNNFLKTMLLLGSERDELSIVNDQKGCPTYAQDLAKCIKAILPKLNEHLQGTYHFCGNASCSWYDFAVEIFNEAKNFGFLTPKSLLPMKTSEYPTLAMRPHYSVMDSSLVSELFQATPSDWKVGIRKALQKI